MTGQKFQLKGFRLNKKTGNVERVPGYGLDASQKIAKKKSKKQKPVRRVI